jgi:hypothetical protein
MMRLSVGCLMMGVLALSLSLFQGVDLSFETGRILFFIFLTLAVLSFIGNLIFERSS